MAAQDSSAKMNTDYLNQLVKEQESLNSQHTNAYKLLQQGMLKKSIFFVLLYVFQIFVSTEKPLSSLRRLDVCWHI